MKMAVMSSYIRVKVGKNARQCGHQKLEGETLHWSGACIMEPHFVDNQEPSEDEFDYSSEDDEENYVGKSRKKRRGLMLHGDVLLPSLLKTLSLST